MAKRSTTFGLGAKNIGRLLALSQEARHEGDGDTDNGDADQAKSQRLMDFLADIPALSADTLDALPTVLQQMCEKMPRLEGASIGTLLFGDKRGDIPPLEPLKQVKALAKDQVSRSPDEDQAEIAGVVYYAAISAALVHHGEKITDFSYVTLKDLLLGFEAMTWLPDRCTRLFQQAHAVCSKQCGS